MFPGRIPVGRQYDRLVRLEQTPPLGEYPLACPGVTRIPELGMCVVCGPIGSVPEGTPLCLGNKPVLRGRRPGDCIRLRGGSKQLKKLFIDKKIPAAQRDRIPVIADEEGVVLVAGIGPDVRRLESPNWEIRIEESNRSACAEK